MEALGLLAEHGGPRRSNGVGARWRRALLTAARPATGVWRDASSARLASESQRPSHFRRRSARCVPRSPFPCHLLPARLARISRVGANVYTAPRHEGEAVGC